MIHPLFKLVATKPQLLADHLEAYADLVSDAMGSAVGRWKHGVLLNAVAVCCLGMAGVLAGVALMLWAVSPPDSIHAPWALWLAPFAPLLVAAVCMLVARMGAGAGAFDKVSAQVREDVAMLREVGAS